MENEKMKVIELLGDLKKGNENLEVYIDSFVNYSESDYICDIITELADSEIDIYNSDLLEWAKDNYSYIDDAIAEFGQMDFYQSIRSGQYLAYTNELYDNLSDYIKVYAYDYILNNKGIEELTQKQYEELESEFDTIDNNDTLENIIDKINDILTGEENENN